MKRKAKILFIQKHSESDYAVLLGKRISSNDEFWWIPGGSVEAGESDFQGALRELEEELFLSALYQEALTAFITAESLPAYIEYDSKQAHNIIFFIILSSQEAIPVPAIKDEFEEMSWFNADTLPRNMSREFSFIEDRFVEKIKQL